MYLYFYLCFCLVLLLFVFTLYVLDFDCFNFCESVMFFKNIALDIILLLLLFYYCCYFNCFYAFYDKAKKLQRMVINHQMGLLYAEPKKC